MERRLFGTNGVRGKVNVDMTCELALRMALAVGTFFKGGKMFVGMDGRLSSPMLKEAVVSGLVATGCIVTDVGTAPTPVIQYAIRHFKPDGGVIITASHNPPEYNGIKTLRGDGIETSREDELIIENIYFSGKFRRPVWNKIGKVVKGPEIVDLYKEAVKSHVNVGKIAERKFHIIVDSGNGVGTLIYPQLLREAGCKVVEINSGINGTFPGRPPEPRPDTLSDLAKTVVKENADLGVAYDGDGDRAIFCDEKGEIHWGDKSAAIIMEHILRGREGEKVVTPISSSKLLEDIAKQCKAEIVWTRVGSIDVTYKMIEIGSIYGCEENGGCFYAPHQPVRDGGLTTLLMLEALAEKGEPLSTLVERLPKYYLRKAKVECPHELKKKALKELLERTKEYERLTIDGVKVITNKGRVLIRPSGTEPVFRIYAESSSPDDLQDISEWAINLTHDIIESVR